MNVTFTELETNLSFDAEIDTLPGVTKITLQFLLTNKRLNVQESAN